MKQHTTPMNFALAAAAAMLLAGATLQAVESDDQIEASFKRTYVYKTYLHDDSVTAAAKGGVLTLTGKVADAYHKALAQEMAAGLPGVVRVDNQLKTEAESATESADAWIGRKVKIALLLHRNVNSSTTTVEVKDGVVTLKGQATSLAQKELTSAYAKDIDGVIEVKNEMTVLAAGEPAERTLAEKIDDASIASQVRMALATHHSTSALKLFVVVRNGVVTLSGIATNDAEKTLVSKLVSDIQGVETINNTMTVLTPLTK